MFIDLIESMAIADDLLNYPARHLFVVYACKGGGRRPLMMRYPRALCSVLALVRPQLANTMCNTIKPVHKNKDFIDLNKLYKLIAIAMINTSHWPLLD